MRSRIIAGTIAALALGTAGVAVAEGTAGQKKNQPAHEQKSESSSTTQGSQGSEVGTTGSDVGTGSDQSQQQIGQQERSEPMKTGINRLDSVKLSVLDEESAKNLQTKLQELGYYQAEIDGKIGPKTKTALSQFFRDQAQLVNKGRLSELAMASLGFEDSEIERVRGLEEEPSEEQRAPTGGVGEDVEGSSGSGSQQGGTQGSKGTMPDVEP